MWSRKEKIKTSPFALSSSEGIQLFSVTPLPPSLYISLARTESHSHSHGHVSCWHRGTMDAILAQSRLDFNPVVMLGITRGKWGVWVQRKEKWMAMLPVVFATLRTEVSLRVSGTEFSYFSCVTVKKGIGRWDENNKCLWDSLFDIGL